MGFPIAHLEREVPAALYVNGEPVLLVEGRMRANKLPLIQWTDRDGQRWEGAVAKVERNRPDETPTPELLIINFNVPQQRRVRRKAASHGKN